MTEASRPSTPPAKTRIRDDIARLPRWKKIMLGASIALMALGIVLMLLSSGSSPADPGPGGVGQSFVDDRNTERPEATENPDASWSGGMFRLGFSFFAGFCIGYAFRAFLKVTALAFGLAFLLLFILQYTELITVDWQAVDGLFARFAERIKNESARFQSFVTGSLPSTGLAGFGIFTGFKKHA